MYKVFAVAALCFGTASNGLAQGFFDGGYIEDNIKGPGTYTLQNGTSETGELRFRTRTASVLFVNKKLKFPAAEVKSFTIGKHTLVPQGDFDFSYGVHSYRAKDAFIEYADTSGGLQLAIYYTTEPIGANTTHSFATYVWRRRGAKNFTVGPNNFKTGGKAYRARMAAGLTQWPELQAAVAAGTVTFENFPDYVRRANQASR